MPEIYYSDAQKHSIFTHFQKCSFQNVPSLRRLTQFIIPQKIILATFIVSLLVYISQNVFASLVVQF